MRSVALICSIALVAGCGSRSRESREVESFTLSDNGSTVIATVMVSPCEDVLGLEFDEQEKLIVLAATVETSEADCDAIGLVVEVSGELPSPLAGRDLVSRPIADP